jgi:hypothetical protein
MKTYLVKPVDGMNGSLFVNALGPGAAVKEWRQQMCALLILPQRVVCAETPSPELLKLTGSAEPGDVTVWTVEE